MGDLPTEFIDMYIERTEGLSSCAADDARPMLPTIRHPQLKYQDMLQIDYTMDMFEPNSPASIYDETTSPVHHLHSMQPCPLGSTGSVTEQPAAQWSFQTPYYEQHDSRNMGPMLMQGPGDIKIENHYMSGEYGVQDNCHRESSLSPPTHDSYMNNTDYGYESDGSVELAIDGSSSGSSPCFQNQVVFDVTSKLRFNNPGRLPQFSEIIPPNMRPHVQKNNRRGRPVTFIKVGHYYSDSDNFGSDEDDRVAPRCRRGAKNILLWKFLLQELRNPNVTHVRWENEHEGTFKFVDTNECSKLWGQMKKKEDMTFEKLSRGIRHYYRDGLMSRKDGIRLVYKFNWDRVPKPFRPHRY